MLPFYKANTLYLKPNKGIKRKKIQASVSHEHGHKNSLLSANEI